MTKPYFVNLTPKQWQQTVDYFNRKRKQSTGQRSRQAVNKKRRKRLMAGLIAYI